MNTIQRVKGKFAEYPQAGLPLAVLLGGVLISALLLAIRKSPPKVAPKVPVTLVKTVSVTPTTTRANLRVFGSTRAVKQLSVQPQVSGNIVAQHKELISGGRIPEGGVVLQIDPRDYETAVMRAEAELAQAEFQLELEKGNQIVAKQEWELLDPELRSDDLSKRLALRKPHLKQREAALQAARSDLRKAQIDLERTKIIAPFDAVVTEENSEVGQFANAQSMLATLVDSSEFFVEVSLPLTQISWISFPQSSGEKGSPATVSYKTTGLSAATREGEVIRLLGEVERTGRMARVLIRVDDPLGIEDNSLPPLLLGTYVEVNIEGNQLSDVFEVPVAALREDSSVWLNKDGKLTVTPVTISLHRENSLIISSGLSAGDEVIVSPVPGALPGMRVENAQEQASE